MSKLERTFFHWLTRWVELACALVGIICFGLYRPWWDFTFIVWQTQREYNKRNNNV